MALEKVVAADLIEIIENGCVQVRIKTTIFEDGKQISSNFHRHVVSPGDDYSNEEDRVKAICAAIHTQSVVDAYKKAQETLKAEV
jgi:hypothetical protein